MAELMVFQDGGERRLTAAEFQHLAAVPAAVEWFANIDNPRTRRAYQNDLEDFCAFIGLATADEFRAVTRSHVLAWRAQLEKRGLAGTTIRRKLAAVAGGNPVHGVKRPRIESNEGKTPALGDQQAKALLDAPDVATLKGLRDRAVLAVLLYHGLRREEAAQLGFGDIVERRGVRHLLVHGKGGKVRYLPLHTVAAERIHAYLERSEHHLVNPKGPLFLPLRGPAERGALPPMVSIKWWKPMRGKRASKSPASACTDCALRRLPMPWSMRQT